MQASIAGSVRRHMSVMSAPEVVKPIRKPNAVYSVQKIARAKALMVCGFTGKAVSRLLNVPYATVVDWSQGKRNHEVQPCQKTIALIKSLA